MDGSRSRFRVSVRELVEWVFQGGDLSREYQSANRMVEGTYGHQEIQQARKDEAAGSDAEREHVYRAEVPVALVVEEEGIQVEISGRIDGVIFRDGEVILEEIKTTLRAAASLGEDDNPIHWAQAACYAAILSELRNLRSVTVRLTYLSLRTRDRASFDRVMGREELGVFLRTVVREYTAWARRRIEWLGTRSGSLRDLRFPFPVWRNGQRELRDAADRVFRDGGRLFVHAPTGIGKTAAILLPALRALADGRASRIFYFTARTTGRNAVFDALRHFHREGMRLKSLFLTARDRICPHAPCDPGDCPLAAGYYDRLRDALVDALEGEDILDRETVLVHARKHRLCPYEFSLDLAVHADLVVGDYNYLFDPRVFLRRFFLGAGGSYLFLVDEAHNLPDRAREMFSASISKQTVLRVSRLLGKDGSEGALKKTLSRLNRFLLSEGKRLEERQGDTAKSIPDGLVELMREVRRAAELLISDRPLFTHRREVGDMAAEAAAFLRICELFDDRFVFLTEQLPGREFRIRLFCVDPSELVSRSLRKGRAAVLFSGTLLPIDFHVDLLGGEGDTLVLPSPFPEENRAVLLCDTVSTLYRKRSESYDAVAELIRTVARSRRGNYLVYFPSYRYLTDVGVRFAFEYGEARPLLQSPSMSEDERDRFLARFLEHEDRALLAFAVMGGIFGEAVDLPGDLLSGAVVVGVGLPQVCLEREVIKDYFDARSDSGFLYAYVFPGMNRVLQAAGRVIRSGSDRGVIVLVDERFGQNPYRRLLETAFPDLRTAGGADGLLRELDAFWDGAGTLAAEPS